MIINFFFIVIFSFFAVSVKGQIIIFGVDIENPKKAEWSKKIDKQYFVETNDSIFPLVLFDRDKNNFSATFYAKKHIFKCDSMEYYAKGCPRIFYHQSYISDYKYVTFLVQYAYQHLFDKFGLPKCDRMNNPDEYIKNAFYHQKNKPGNDYWVNFEVFWEVKEKGKNYIIMLDIFELYEGCLIRVRYF